MLLSVNVHYAIKHTELVLPHTIIIVVTNK